MAEYRVYGVGDTPMQKRPWKIIAHGAGSCEYFIVRALDSQAALRVLHVVRPNLANARCEGQGEASPEMLDWLQAEADVFSIAMAR
jgi:hypothetical protein